MEVSGVEVSRVEVSGVVCLEQVRGVLQGVKVRDLRCVVGVRRLFEGNVTQVEKTRQETPQRFLTHTHTHTRVTHTHTHTRDTHTHTHVTHHAYTHTHP